MRDYFEHVVTALPGRAIDFFRMRDSTCIDAIIEQGLIDPKAGRGGREKEVLVFQCILRMRDHHILQLGHLRTLAAWDLAADGPLEWQTPALGPVLAARTPEDDKFDRLVAARAV